MSLAGVKSTGQWLSSTAIQAAKETAAFAAKSGNWTGKQVVALGSQARDGAVFTARFGYEQLSKLASLVQSVFHQLMAAGCKAIATVTPYLSQASQSIVNLLKANAREIKIVAATAVATLVLAHLANKYFSKEAQSA